MAIADAPLTSFRPQPRPDLIGGAALESTRASAATVSELIAQARLDGRVGFVVADARTGVFLESREPESAMPPASVAKAVTALYGLTALGSDYRFPTQLMATGPVRDGVIQGDLLLVGSGDPVLDTDALAELVAVLKTKGVRGVSGGFKVYAGALPYVRSIDRSQPDHVGYNPAVSGVNLNFNRVHFQWQRQDAGWAVALDARSATLRPAVTVAKMSVVQRELPTYTYRDARGVDEWTVASAALGNGGTRWLPVRRPDLYAGEVFQVLASTHGIKLPKVQPVHALPQASVIASHRSAKLSSITRGMLKHSTNLTAEVIGLSASAARGAHASSLKASAGAMSDWLRREFGASTARFVDHSGLGDLSRLSPSDMVRMLVKIGPNSALHAHLKTIVPKDRAGEADPTALHKIHAKTGSLNFVSTLAGYVTAADGTPLAFAIFTADMPRRNTIAPDDRERPDGARAWARRSRWLQHQLLNRWATLYIV